MKAHPHSFRNLDTVAAASRPHKPAPLPCSARMDLFGGATPKWSTSILAVSETYTWFLHRMGEEQARTFRQLIDNLSALQILDATRDHHTAVIRMLDRYRGAKLSYTDASSLVHLEKRKIKQVWSTDHHLGLSGAEVLPRS